MPVPPSGTVTFLFTDIEGSTKLWEQMPDAMQSALARHDALLRSAIESYGGYVFKTVGDAFCAAFSSAPDALNAAIAAQRWLEAEVWGECVIRSRMGLHTGTAEERDGDYFGPTLNRVARLQAAGHGGQTLLSLATMELVRDQLSGGVGLLDLGERRLKDLIRPEHVFQVSAADLPNEFPPLKTLDLRPTNLPVQATPFIGREAVTAEVKRLLAGTRLLTLTGPGGTGKTRLSLQVAADMIDEFEHGVYFVPLAPISDAALVKDAIAEVLTVTEVSGHSLIDSLKDYLRDKFLLLVLDNFEQVIDAAPIVSDLLSAAPHLKIIVTSREVLRVYGEQEFAVPPLALPDPKRSQPLAVMSQYEAVSLFIQRAQSVKPDFAISEANAPAIAEICVRLDGLPLAIELAAARIKLFTPEALLSRLEKRLQTLTSGARDLPARQQTLRGTIDWSYQLLKADEQRLFQLLGVFVGGWTFESAEGVAAQLEREIGTALDVLAGMESLVNKSLVKQIEGYNYEPRFTLLETLREYALERLNESGEAPNVHNAHAAYFLSFAENIEQRQFYDYKLFADLETDHDNLRAALRWYLSQSDDAEYAMRLTGALGWFWYTHGHFAEGYRWAEEALKVDHEGIPDAIRANALNSVGVMAFTLSNHTRAQVTHSAALAIYRELGNEEHIALSLGYLAAQVAVLGGHGIAQAIELSKEAMTIARRRNYMPAIAIVGVILGAAFYNAGDMASAKALAEEALAAAHELNNHWMAIYPLSNLSELEAIEGKYERALSYLQESMQFCRETNDRHMLSFNLFNTAYILKQQGAYDEAKTYSEEGLALARDIGDKVGMIEALLNLGDLLHRLEDFSQSSRVLREALLICREMDDKMVLIRVLEMNALLLFAQGQQGQSARLFATTDSERAAMNFHNPLFDYTAAVADLRAHMGDAAFEAAFSAGRTMTLEQALDYALE